MCKKRKTVHADATPPRLPKPITSCLNLTAPHLGSRAGVCSSLATVSVDGDTGVRLSGISGDVSEIVTAGLRSAATSDLKLSTFLPHISANPHKAPKMLTYGVELRCVGLMKSKKLMTNQVVARSKSRRHL
jgi:hypothetical protein